MSTATTPDAAPETTPRRSPDARPAPTITNDGWTPATRHKLFVNLPVADLQRSITFFEALGFRFNSYFTDATATCMLVGEDAYVMLLTPDRFRGFSGREIPDAHATTAALYALSMESRPAVDAMVAAAMALGGTAAPVVDHGFMYQSGFHDLDGHHWEVFWMDPAAVPG